MHLRNILISLLDCLDSISPDTTLAIHLHRCSRTHQVHEISHRSDSAWDEEELYDQGYESARPLRTEGVDQNKYK